MPRYTFDVKLDAAFTLDAATADDGIAILRSVLNCASVNAGAIPGGWPLLGEATMNGMPRLAMIDGEDVVLSEDEKWVQCAVDHFAEFELCDTDHGPRWYVRDRQEETLRVDATDACLTMADAARTYCESYGCEP